MEIRYGIAKVRTHNFDVAVKVRVRKNGKPTVTHAALLGGYATPQDAIAACDDPKADGEWVNRNWREINYV